MDEDEGHFQGGGDVRDVSDGQGKGGAVEREKKNTVPVDKSLKL